MNKCNKVFEYKRKEVLLFRSRPPEVFLEKGILKICSKFIIENPCRSEISIVTLQLYWNHTSAWVFSCEFAAYFQKFLIKTPLEGCFWLFQEKSNNEHDRTPVRYLNVLYHKEHKSSCDTFLQKYYQLPILNTLDMSGPFLQKQ